MPNHAHTRSFLTTEKVKVFLTDPIVMPSGRYNGWSYPYPIIFNEFVSRDLFQSENIGKSVYCSGWECGIANVPGVRASLLIVARRAREPLVLTAGGFFDLSLASYTTVSQKIKKTGTKHKRLALQESR